MHDTHTHTHTQKMLTPLASHTCTIVFLFIYSYFLFTEIKELYQQRQQLRDAFRQQQMHYMRASREQRVCERALVEEQARRREEERKSNREARMRKL